MGRWAQLPADFQPGTEIQDDFVGINIATSDDPACTAYVLDAIQALGVTHVRINYSYDSVGGQTAELLEKSVATGLKVLLTLLPPGKAARKLVKDPETQRCWREFVATTLGQYGASVDAIELGNTPNRGKWSGFSLAGYTYAWRILCEVAESIELATPLAGPNVSDFEPFYNHGLLRAMMLTAKSPHIQTDNLFVERVVQPERNDLRAVGQRFGNRYRLNLPKKMAIIRDIGSLVGVEKNYCTYTCWTRKRLSRWSASPERKHADYLVRYLVIAAAAGHFDRIYWGPLVDERDGLIRCGDPNYPRIDNVSYYQKIRGAVSDFEPTRAYQAFGYARTVLKNLRCEQGFSSADGISHFIFTSMANGDEYHITWCVDRKQYALTELYGDLGSATATDVFGEETDLPIHVSESPLILKWPDSLVRPSVNQLEAVQPIGPEGTTFGIYDADKVDGYSDDVWRGVVRQASTAPSELSPAAIEQRPVNRVLRDKRNRLWNVPDADYQELTIKLNRAIGIKRISYQWQQSKGQRHWNNAVEMLRRGVETPLPVAFFEQRQRSGVTDNYYVCQFIPNAFSCRDLFTAFAQGESGYRGKDKSYWLSGIAQFVAYMHRKRVIHRDLSSGNILMTLASDKCNYYAIDIGRARFDSPRSTGAVRLKDLKRICYKLSWEDREAFIEYYNTFYAGPLPSWWRWSLRGYDAKQRSKKFIKGGRRRSIAK